MTAVPSIVNPVRAWIRRVDRRQADGARHHHQRRVAGDRLARPGRRPFELARAPAADTVSLAEVVAPIHRPPAFGDAAPPTRLRVVAVNPHITSAAISRSTARCCHYERPRARRRRCPTPPPCARTRRGHLRRHAAAHAADPLTATSSARSTSPRSRRCADPGVRLLRILGLVLFVTSGIACLSAGLQRIISVPLVRWLRSPARSPASAAMTCAPDARRR